MLLQNKFPSSSSKYKELWIHPWIELSLSRIVVSYTAQNMKCSHVLVDYLPINLLQFWTHVIRVESLLEKEPKLKGKWETWHQTWYQKQVDDAILWPPIADSVYIDSCRVWIPCQLQLTTRLIRERSNSKSAFMVGALTDCWHEQKNLVWVFSRLGLEPLFFSLGPKVV